MKKFYLTGDILKPGVVEVEAETLDEALEKAEQGEFRVYDEQDSCMGFTWCGDDEGGVHIEDEEDEEDEEPRAPDNAED